MIMGHEFCGAVKDTLALCFRQDAVVSAGQTSVLDFHIVSSTSASVLLDQVVDAPTLYLDASDVYVGHSMTGGTADL